MSQFFLQIQNQKTFALDNFASILKLLLPYYRPFLKKYHSNLIFFYFQSSKPKK